MATMEARKIVGYRVREERQRLGMSQAKLAEIVNDLLLKGKRDRWYPQTVGALEKGERAFTIDDLVALRYALWVSLDHLTTPPPGESIEVGSGITLEVPPDSGIEALLLNDVERAVHELKTYIKEQKGRRE